MDTHSEISQLEVFPFYFKFPDCGFFFSFYKTELVERPSTLLLVFVFFEGLALLWGSRRALSVQGVPTLHMSTTNPPWVHEMVTGELCFFSPGFLACLEDINKYNYLKDLCYLLCELSREWFVISHLHAQLLLLNVWIRVTLLNVTVIVLRPWFNKRENPILACLISIQTTNAALHW